MLSTTQMSKPTCHCRIGLQGSQIRGPGFVTPQNCLRDLRFAMIMMPFSAQSGSKVYPKGNRLQWRRVDSIVLQKVPLISQGCSDHLRFLCISCIYIYICLPKLVQRTSEDIFDWHLLLPVAMDLGSDARGHRLVTAGATCTSRDFTVCFTLLYSTSPSLVLGLAQAYSIIEDGW